MRESAPDRATTVDAVQSTPPVTVSFSLGAGQLTVANDVVVFVAPAGPDADRWSRLAVAPATEAEIQRVIASGVPEGHHVALYHLVEGGVAYSAIPGQAPVIGSIQQRSEAEIRFGMAPPASNPHWLASGVVGASGFAVRGYAVAEVEAEPPPPAPGNHAAGAFFPPPPQPPPPEMASAHAEPGPAPPHQSPDAPVLSTGFFTELPTESDPPVIERVPTPPPPGPDRPGMRPIDTEHIATDAPQNQPPAGERRNVLLRFDDGQKVPLTQALAVGRAPSGSNDVPGDAAIVVVSGDQVSRCHFVIRPTEHGVVVTDTTSLNGCFIDDPDRPGSGPQLPVGVPVPIEVGQTLRFGDRTVELLRA